MTSRLLSLLIWAAVAACAVFWGLRLWVKPQAVPGSAVVASGGAAVAGDLSRLLGNPPVQALPQALPVAVESRFKLVGVVAPRAGRDSGQASGLALISVDGKPARTVGVGREVEPGLRLLAVSQRQADLGAGGSAPRLALTLPMLAEANRGRPADLPGDSGQPNPTNLPNLPNQPNQPNRLPLNGVPGAMLGLPGGVAPQLPPGVAQRLMGQAQPGLPLRAMPSESADDPGAPVPATR